MKPQKTKLKILLKNTVVVLKSQVIESAWIPNAFIKINENCIFYTKILNLGAKPVTVTYQNVILKLSQNFSLNCCDKANFIHNNIDRHDEL